MSTLTGPPTTVAGPSTTADEVRKCRQPAGLPGIAAPSLAHCSPPQGVLGSPRA